MWCIKCVPTEWRHWSLHPISCVGSHMCVLPLYPFVLVIWKSIKIMQWPITHILTIWNYWPLMIPRWDPHFNCGHMCVPTPICFYSSPMNVHQSMCEGWAILLGVTFFAHKTHTTPHYWKWAFHSPFFGRGQ